MKTDEVEIPLAQDMIQQYVSGRGCKDIGEVKLVLEAVIRAAGCAHILVTEGKMERVH